MTISGPSVSALWSAILPLCDAETHYLHAAVGQQHVLLLRRVRHELAQHHPLQVAAEKLELLLLILRVHLTHLLLDRLVEQLVPNGALVHLSPHE